MEQHTHVPVVPKLPELLTDSSVGHADALGEVSEVELKKKFQSIDLDADDNHDHDNEDEEEDYTPSSSGHFHPVVESLYEKKPLPIPKQEVTPTAQPKQVETYVLEEPAFDSEDIEEDDQTHRAGEPEYEYDPNVATSVFAPFPSELPETEEEFIAMMKDAEQKQKSSDTQTLNGRSDEGSDIQEITLPTSPIHLKVHNESNVVPNSPIDQDLTYSEEEEEHEYVPKKGHFHSEIIVSPVKATNGSPEESSSHSISEMPELTNTGLDRSDSFEVVHNEPIPPVDAMITDDYVQNEQYHSVDADDEDDHAVPHGSEITSHDQESVPSSMNKNNLVIDASNSNLNLEPPQHSPAAFELSDTDTLHIHETNDALLSGGSSIREISKEEAAAKLSSIPHSDSARFANEQLEEHAYLSDLIHTPIVDDSLEHFQPVERDDNDEQDLEVPNDSSRNSQFYSSVSDYFDDYADEEHHHDGLSLAKSRSRSSGSLSTGSFSLHSEHRSSKMSDRTASFTNQSISQLSEMQSIAESSKDVDNGGETQLNSALSINMGHWRPNTDSFRDQFINGSSVTPPLPKLDNYTRTSTGGILEDESGNYDSHTEKDTSILSSTNDSCSEVELPPQSRNLKDGVYKTDSDTFLPVHIPISTFDSSMDAKAGGHFQEHLSDTSSHPSPMGKSTESKAPLKRAAVGYSVKNISTLKDPQQRITKYREARQEEANIETALELWISQVLDKVEVVSYKSNVTSHVKQAYAEASNFSRKHTNMGSLLKRRVIQETSSQTAHSFAKGAKGIFSRGRKIIKNEK